MFGGQDYKPDLTCFRGSRWHCVLARWPPACVVLLILNIDRSLEADQGTGQTAIWFARMALVVVRRR